MIAINQYWIVPIKQKSEICVILDKRKDKSLMRILTPELGHTDRTVWITNEEIARTGKMVINEHGVDLRKAPPQYITED